jgi:type II secretory pathway component GspD/PulD (secretin)
MLRLSGYVCCCVLTLLLVRVSPADDRASQPSDAAAPAAPLSSTILRPKHVDAATVSKVLQTLNVNVIFAVDPRTNSLVLRGSEEDLQTVIAVVQKLDEPTATEPGRQIVTEVSVLKVAPDAKSGTPEELRGLLEEVAPSERIRSRRSFVVRTLENQDGQLQVGGNQYVTVGQQFDPRFGDRGGGQRSYNSEVVGTILHVNGRETPDGRIQLSLTFESSGFAESRPVDEGPPPPGKETLNFSSAVAVRPGEPVVLGVSETRSSASGDKLLIVLRSSFVEE